MHHCFTMLMFSNVERMRLVVRAFKFFELIYVLFDKSCTFRFHFSSHFYLWISDLSFANHISFELVLLK